MNIELSDQEFRRLLDLVYIGNWILNSTREEGRIAPFDELESKIFSYCIKAGQYSLFEIVDGEVLPSREYTEGGIHEAIMDYEDTVFYEILAEELARKDMNFAPINAENFNELAERIDEYIDEFERNGVDNLTMER